MECVRMVWMFLEDTTVQLLGLLKSARLMMGDSLLQEASHLKSPGHRACAPLGLLLASSFRSIHG